MHPSALDYAALLIVVILAFGPAVLVNWLVARKEERWGKPPEE